MRLPILGLIAVSFVISCLITFIMIRVAPRVGFVDKPGARKIHANPKPLGGGVAIFWAWVLPLAGIVLYAWLPSNLQHIEDVSPKYALVNGVIVKTSLAFSIMIALL